MATGGWVLITGASSGIGAAMAELVVERGRKVILTARSTDKLEALAESLRAKGGTVEVIPADLSKPADVDRLWSKASQDRKINFLINNAGLGSYAPLAQSDWDRERLSIEVNVIALTRLCQLGVQHMADQEGGRILNVASVAATLTCPDMAVYGATKAYVLHFSNALRAEVADQNITVTTLCPGPTSTEFFQGAQMTDLQMVKKGKHATPRKVAERGYFAAMRGRPVVVEGTLNSIAYAASSVLPTGWMAKIAKGQMGTQ
ncbi:SDR family NAD(P)-dependent oxidoreductase [Halovulum sp. GXIMD14793]